MKLFQHELQLPAHQRGYHLITSHILRAIPELREISAGQLHVFIKHTSASLTINENADPTVRMDFESHINKMVPENMPYYRHDTEGADDMPAHIKASLMGGGNHTYYQWQAKPGPVAGDIPVRAPQPRWQPRSCYYSLGNLKYPVAFGRYNSHRYRRILSQSARTIGGFTPRARIF